MLDIADLLFVVAISLLVYSVTGKNEFWTGIILLVIAILWVLSTSYHEKSQLK